MKVVLRCTLKEGGEQSVMMHGALVMPQLPVDNLTSLEVTFNCVTKYYVMLYCNGHDDLDITMST